MPRCVSRRRSAEPGAVQPDHRALRTPVVVLDHATAADDPADRAALDQPVLTVHAVFLNCTVRHAGSSP
jgi:hypothetical protein